MKRIFRNTAFVFLFVFLLLELLLLSLRGLWFDELDWGIAFIARQSLADGLRDLIRSGTTPPGFLLILTPFYRLFPANDFLLRLPFLILTACGILLLFTAIRKNTGEKDRDTASLLLLVLLAASPGFLRQCVQIRPYSLLFFSASLFLLYDGERRKEPSRRNLFGSGFAIFLMLFCHYIALLYAGFIFLRDLAGVWRKKYSVTVLSVTVLPGILMFPWYLTVFLNRTGHAGSLWFRPPGLYYLITVFYSLSGLAVSGFLLHLGIVLSLILWKRIRSETEKRFLGSVLLPAAGVWLLIWGLNRFFRLPLFLPRYFIVIVPSLAVCAVSGMLLPLFRFIQQKHGKTASGLLFLCAVLFPLMGGEAVLRVCSTRHYREYARYLEDPDLQQDDSMLLCYGEEWLHHYLERTGKLPCHAAVLIRLSFDGQWRGAFPDRKLSPASRKLLEKFRKKGKWRWKAPCFSRVIRNGCFSEEEPVAEEQLLGKRFLFILEDQGPLHPETEAFLQKHYHTVLQTRMFRKLERNRPL